MGFIIPVVNAVVLLEFNYVNPVCSLPMLFHKGGWGWLGVGRKGGRGGGRLAGLELWGRRLQDEEGGNSKVPLRIIILFQNGCRHLP